MGIRIRTFFFILIALGYILSCNKRKEKRRVFSGYYVISDFVNDTIFNGDTKFFDLDDNLLSKVQYNNGIKEGIEINYYKNGRVRSSYVFNKGIRKGKFLVNDSVGNILQEGMFFDGEKIGYRYSYLNGKLSTFSSFGLNDTLLFSVKYDTNSNPIAYKGSPINIDFTPNDNHQEESYYLQLGVIKPPRMNINYFLGISNIETKEEKRLCMLNSDKYIFDTILPTPNAKWQYIIISEVSDFKKGFKEITILPIEISQ